MDRQLPPEFLQAIQGMTQQPPGGAVQPPASPTGGVAIPPAPEFGMSLMEGIPPQGQVMPPTGGMTDSAPPDAGMGLPPIPGPGLGDAQPQDDTLLSMMNQAPEVAYKYKKPPKPRPITEEMAEIYAEADKRLHMIRLMRIQRDISIYRQHEVAVPHGFDPRKDWPAHSATLTNLVNKMAALLSAPEARYIMPFKTEQTRKDTQVVEDFGYQCREYEQHCYASSGGNSLQYDEVFYLLLHGTLVARILPDPEDIEYPFHFSLLDPATCFPTFKGDKYGMERMIRSYRSSVIDILGIYGRNDPKLERRLMNEMGYDAEDMRDFYTEEGEVVEYWDKWYRCVLFNGITIMKMTEHGYENGKGQPVVPFVWVGAKGEPKSMSTPLAGGSSGRVDEYNNAGYGGSRETDIAEKNVSIFHHLINTNRLVEVTHTLALMEVEKSQNPATITYSAPGYGGRESQPLNQRKGGNNQRVLNFQKVEAIPTSPRPTDFAPVVNKAMTDLTEGGLPPVAHGTEQGSNISGFALESLLAAVKDVALPYTKAYEVFLRLALGMKLGHAKKFVLPLRGILVPGKTSYGESALNELTLEMLNRVGTDVQVKLFAMAQQTLPGQIQAATMAVQAGIWPLRKAMEHVGSLDPDRDFQDIIAERAIQHPEIMENFIIPQGFINRGSTQLAELWMQLVVMPKMMRVMGGAGQGMEPQALPGEGGENTPPEPNGQSNPMMGLEAPPPGGPAPGEGRGPAPA